MNRIFAWMIFIAFAVAALSEGIASRLATSPDVSASWVGDEYGQCVEAAGEDKSELSACVNGAPVSAWLYTLTTRTTADIVCWEPGQDQATAPVSKLPAEPVLTEAFARAGLTAKGVTDITLVPFEDRYWFTGNQNGLECAGNIALLKRKHTMDKVTSGAMDMAKASVTLAIGLVGGMALFLGLVKVAEEGGLLLVIAKLVRPIMIRLFPDVPPDHPAMGAMILNMSANALGLGNAATPFGIRAMIELNKLNPNPGTATNAMALFLAINTSSVTILPTGAIVWRQTMGSADPSGIMATTLFATICSTTCAIVVAKTLQGWWPAAAAHVGGAATIDEAFAEPDMPDIAAPTASEAYPLWVTGLAMAAIASIIPLTIVYGEQISPWIVPSIIVFFLGFGWVKDVPVYEVFVRGAKEGFEIAVLIIPYLVAILAAIGMLRGSGALDLTTALLGRVTAPFGLPGEALPMALIRPLSGSGATGVMADIMGTHHPDSYTGYLVSTMQGSTETTFYVLAVYFGAVRVRDTRHTMVAAIAADIMGVIAAVVICSWLYGHLPLTIPHVPPPM